MMKLKNLYSNWYLQPILHVLFWSILLFTPYLFRNTETWRGMTDWQYKMLFFKILLAILFYFNTYFLYPKVYKKHGFWIYLLSVAATVAVLYFTSQMVSEYIDKTNFSGIKPDRPRGYFGPRKGGPKFHPSTFDIFWFMLTERLLPYLFVVVISFSYCMVLDNSLREKEHKDKENENLKTELSFLRSQVSPHFIFNILNNMVALARKKSDQLEPSLIQLSNLMRYMLYEDDDEKVTLDKEIGYLKSYIDLQLLRFGEDVTITFNPPANTGAYKIEPMLLAPFVENAFKHGVGMVDNPQINIMLEINSETDWLDFKVMNTIAPQQDSKDKDSGIGLVNVRRRLELLYHDNFSLDIMKTGSVFIADLKLKLA
jgi:hypothetical protein